MARPRSDPEHWMEIGHDFYQGVTKKQLAAKYRKSPNTILRAIRCYDRAYKEIDWSKVSVSDCYQPVELPEASGSQYWNDDDKKKPSDQLKRKILRVFCVRK